MVPFIPDAVPRYVLSTEFMIALMFGYEKRPNPIPTMVRQMMTQ
jgi:hypothetical protein